MRNLIEYTLTKEENDDLATRRGVFDVAFMLVSKRPLRLSKIMSDMVILRAEVDYARSVIRYTALSKHFRSLANDVFGIPRYRCLLHSGRTDDGGVIRFSHEWQEATGPDPAAVTETGIPKTVGDAPLFNIESFVESTVLAMTEFPLRGGVLSVRYKDGAGATGFIPALVANDQGEFNNEVILALRTLLTAPLALTGKTLKSVSFILDDAP